MSLKKLHLITLGVLVTIALAINSDDGEEANAYVDALLRYLRKDPEKAAALDPLNLPEITEDNHALKDIQVTGLSNLRRDSDALIIDTGGVKLLMVDLTAKNVSVTMNCRLKMLFFETEVGDASAVYDGLSVRLIASKSQQNLTTTMLKIVRTGNSYVKYNGYTSILSMNVDCDEVVQSASGSIFSALESKVREAFDSDTRSLLPYVDEKFRSSGDTGSLLE